MKRVGVCTVASFVLFFTLMVVCPGTLGEKKEAEEATTVSLINSLRKNQHVAELLWVHCRQELMHGNEVVEDLDRSVPEVKAINVNDFVGRLLVESKTKKSHSSVLSDIDHFILKCVRKKNLMFLLSVEDTVPKNWFTQYLDAIRGRPYAQRDLMQNFGGSPAPSPVGISPDAVPASSTPEIPLWPPKSPYGFGDSAFQPSSDEKSLSGSNLSDVQSNTQKSTSRDVFVAVVVTAPSTFILLALLFLCYRKLFSGSRKEGNDSRPFLSLSPSDHSVASSQKSFTLSTSSSTEKTSSKVFDINSDCNIETGDFYLRSPPPGDSKINDLLGTVAGAGCKAADSFTPLTSDKRGLPPLKLPPGRKNLSIPTPGPGKTDPYPLVSPPPAPAPPPPRPPAASPSPPPAPPLSKISIGGPRPLAPGPPPVPLGSKTAPPLPPLNGVVTPPRPPPIGLKPPRPSPIGSSKPSHSSRGEGDEADVPKAKLKPFFWDKVLANPEQSMVWHQIRSGSFQFNEEMIEALFGYAPTGKNKSQQKESSPQDPSSNYVQIIDPKKSQNLSILLKALNVTTEEVCDAIQEGNELPSELIHSLLKMAPTTDEELKLRLYSGDLSRLGTADRFLKVLVDIPFAFRRLEMLLFMCTLQEEEAAVKESFSTLEAACMELRESRLFLKLLEAVLKTGNRMNDGTFRGGAQAFKLDTLLKLSDVKGLDGKTTLLHFVVQEIIRSEGARAARATRENRSMSSISSDDLLVDSSSEAEDNYRSIGLQVVSGLDNELENVKRAAVLDADSVTGTVAKLGEALIKARGFLNSEMETVEEENGFYQALRSFVQNAEVDVTWLLEEEKRIMALAKSTGDYFHGKCGKDEGLRLFVIVRDFLISLERVCKEVKNSPRTPTRPPKKDEMKMVQSEQPQSPLPDTRQRIFAAIKNRQMEDSSSDDDSP